MADEEKEIVNNITNCVQDCSNCTSSCDSNLNNSGPSFFERLESISEGFDGIDDEDLINMLNDAVAELEAEDAEEEKKDDAE